MRKRQRKKNRKAETEVFNNAGPIVSIRRCGNEVVITRRLTVPVRTISCECKIDFGLESDNEPV